MPQRRQEEQRKLHHSNDEDDGMAPRMQRVKQPTEQCQRDSRGPDRAPKQPQADDERHFQYEVENHVWQRREPDRAAHSKHVAEDSASGIRENDPVRRHAVKLPVLEPREPQATLPNPGPGKHYLSRRRLTHVRPSRTAFGTVASSPIASR
jgi:hypothetical protein